MTMSQLKQDEWPADGEPTTTESQERPSGSDVRGLDRSSVRAPTDPDAVDELSNVTPDEQVD
jgi:hypothetical protein